METNKNNNAMSNNEIVKKLKEISTKNAEISEMIENIIQQIDWSGYIEVEGIVRRWLPSQCIMMLNNALNGNSFHNQIVQRGYKYSWKVLLDELKRQSKMLKNGDASEFEERNKFYNKQLAYRMASNYTCALNEYIHDIQRNSNCETICIKLSNYYCGTRFIFVKSALSIVNDMNEICKQIQCTDSKNISELCRHIEKFNNLRILFNFAPKMDRDFINVYKASGAYYTMKDLILYEGCRIIPAYKHPCKAQNEEEAIDMMIDEMMSIFGSSDIISDIMQKGYMLLGMLKEFLKLNHIDTQRLTENWSEQSNERRKCRMENRSNRRINK